MTTTIAGLPVHDAANLFPLIEGKDFDALVADIRDHGQMEPIVLDADGQIIDGRNRARACEQLNIRPTTKRYDAGDVVQFVVSHNLHRRHLNDAQRAMIAAKLITAQEGRPGETRSYDQVSRQQAADMLHVSAPTVGRAKRIRRNGTEALQSAVADGLAPIATAVRVADLPDAEQDEYAKQVRDGADPVKTAPPQKDGHRRKKETDALSFLSKTAVADRVATARRMAAEGALSSQIAKAIGIQPRTMPAFRKRHGVEVPADAVVGRTLHIDPARVVEETVNTIEALAEGLHMIEDRIGSLDADKRREWVSSLRPSLAALSRFTKELAR